MALSGSTNSEKIWNYCKSKGMNDFGCASVLSSLDHESGLNPKNLEDQYQNILGFSDETYVSAVDSGRYVNFVKDCAGFGLAQWTWWTRKQGLLSFAQSRGVSIGDMEMQLDFMYKELSESFPSVLKTLMNASSVLQASNAMLLQYERPADMGESMQSRRAATAQQYYNKFSNKTTEVKTSMGYYTVAKYSKTKLSDHFNSNEFDCHGSGCCSQTLINKKLVEYLEKIREHFGKPITVTSGYRCVTHNRNVGGATGSRHAKGDAADIVISGVTPAEVAKYAENIGIKGIGLYETSKDGHFVHIDTRDIKSFWYGQSCAARTTFGGSTGSVTQTGSTSNAAQSNALLSTGSKGNAVKELQQNLVSLGYNIAVDGSFGPKTRSAVLDYQRNHGLVADGIVGDMTRKSIAEQMRNASLSSSYSVRVTANVLNIRKGAGTNYAIVGSISDKGTYLISDESTGVGANMWGKLADGRGWISLDYCMKS